MIADSDEVVGAAQGRKLHDNYLGPKFLIALPGAGHNSFDIQPHAAWFAEVSAFLRGAR
jgi:pimeloyl-ACP methyl ester carboxylesterase